MVDLLEALARGGPYGMLAIALGVIATLYRDVQRLNNQRVEEMAVNTKAAIALAELHEEYLRRLRGER